MRMFGLVSVSVLALAVTAYAVLTAVAYPFVAWLCWVPNLLIAEWILNGVSAEPVETTSVGASS